MSKRRSSGASGTGELPPESEPKRHPLQRFEAQDMRRSELKAAPYNPRIITSEEKRRLSKELESLGLLAALVWNKRTGHIVSGHQRLNILDKLADGAVDYLLTMAVVDLDEEREVEANIAFNNPDAQGAFELEKLEAIFKRPNLVIENTGYDRATAYRLFGYDPLHKGDAQDDAAREKAVKRVLEYQDAYREIAEKKKFEHDYYLVLVFKDHDERQRFTDAFELEDNRYQDGRTLQQLLVSAKHGDATQDPKQEPVQR